MQNIIAARMIKEPCVAIQVKIVLMMLSLYDVVLFYYSMIIFYHYVLFTIKKIFHVPFSADIKRIPATCHSREDMR